MRAYLTTLLLLMLATGAAASELVLKDRLDCQGVSVRLGDLLASGSAGDLDSRRIAESPAPGVSKVLTRQRLARQLADWNWRGSLRGPETLTLETPGVVVDTKRLRQAVEARLAEELSARGLRLVAVTGGWSESLILATPRVRWLLILPAEVKARTAEARVSIADAAGFERGFVLRFECERPLAVALANEKVSRGGSINDWQLVEMDGFRIMGAPLTESELIGSVATRKLDRGDPITEHNARTAPLVRSGREVEVRLQRGAVTVTTRGVARNDGGLGEMVTVRHLDSRELKRYRVAGHGVVVPAYLSAKGDES